MYCIQFGDNTLHSKSLFVILFTCFRFLKRMVRAGYIIHIFKY